MPSLSRLWIFETLIQTLPSFRVWCYLYTQPLCKICTATRLSADRHFYVFTNTELQKYLQLWRVSRGFQFMNTFALHLAFRYTAETLNGPQVLLFYTNNKMTLHPKRASADCILTTIDIKVISSNMLIFFPTPPLNFLLLIFYLLYREEGCRKRAKRK